MGGLKKDEVVVGGSRQVKLALSVSVSNVMSNVS